MVWRLATLAILGIVVLTAAIAWTFQDRIAEFRLNPRAPYQTYAPPPAPDYADGAAWAMRPDDPAAGAADIFYIHSTTFASREHWNGPVDDDAAAAALERTAAPNEAGPFLRLGAVYAPRYRQATLFASFTHKFEGLAARELAYQDVKAAFRRFIAGRDPARPLFIVGYGEGGLHALGLLQHVVAKDDDLRARLVASYVIGVGVPRAVFGDALAAVPPCRYPTDSGCVIAYAPITPDLEADRFRLRQRALVWTADDRLRSVSRPDLVCVNPVLGGATPVQSAPAAHHGAASATGLRLDETPPAIRSAVTAQCVDGVLSVSTPEQAFLRVRRWFGAQWRPQPFNIFYHDLVADARRRLHNYERMQSAQNVLSINDLRPEIWCNAETR